MTSSESIKDKLTQVFEMSIEIEDNDLIANKLAPTYKREVKILPYAMT